MIHGGQIFKTARQLGISPEELTDFSANINPQGMPKEIREAVLQSMDSLSHYPDIECGPLKEAIAKAEGINPGWVLCGNGAADLVFRLIYAARPKRAMVMAPTFLEYERALEQTETAVIRFPLNSSLELDDSVLEAVTEDLDMIFLCNPNNPTGLLTNRDLVLRLVDKAGSRGAMVVLDECFMDFVCGQEAYSCVNWLGDFKNLLILKSFTKMYAMAGLRLGYCLCSDTGLLGRMDQAGQDWGVNTPAQAAGLAALRLSGFADRTRRIVAEERARLTGALTGLGLTVYEGQANYLLFHAPGQGNLCERLLPHRIMIRSCGNYPGLTNEHYRVAVKSAADNEKLTAALREVLGCETKEETGR